MKDIKVRFLSNVNLFSYKICPNLSSKITVLIRLVGAIPRLS